MTSMRLTRLSGPGLKGSTEATAKDAKRGIHVLDSWPVGLSAISSSTRRPDRGESFDPRICLFKFLCAPVVLLFITVPFLFCSVLYPRHGPSRRDQCPGGSV